MNLLEDLGYEHLLDIKEDFAPFNEADFLEAHTRDYVEAFFRGTEPLCMSNSIPWSQDFAQTVRYTNASLYEAIKHSLVTPKQVALSPTSGFHHAGPDSGGGFCTFSGQVIASTKLFKELGARGAYLDLDGHFGNSIEDSRRHVPELNEAIPYGCNINPHGRDERYVNSLKSHLENLRLKILDDKIDYVVWCHGADSHNQDDLDSGECDTFHWLECSRVFFQWVRDLDTERGKPLPVTIALFGGYRSDDFKSVLELHVADITQCSSVLLGVGEPHEPQVKDRWGYEAYHPGQQ